MSDHAEGARKLWSLGEYELAAVRLEPAAEALADAAEVNTGMRVLDVAAGTGNVAIAAAQRGAQVTASDITPSMIERGRARMQALGLDIDWDEADAQALPYDDAGFDRVLSAFGAMFAPDPAAVTAELLRVTRPGGLVGLTTWVHDGIQRSAAGVLADVMGAPPDVRPVPEQWGDAEVAAGWFSAHGADVTIEERRLSWPFESPEAWIEFMERGAPPFVAVRAALGEDRWAEVRPKLLDVVREHGRETDDGFLVEPPYLLILARR